VTRTDDFPHASRSDATSVHFGFYDAGWHIAVLPKLTVRPSVVVDHEVTHVNITRQSGIGLLERLSLFLRWVGEQAGSDALIRLATVALEVLRSAGTPVHEAVAWLDSELLTLGKEELHAPRAHADGVRLLRALFASIREPPFEDIPAGYQQVMAISESIATYALSPPMVDRYTAAQEQFNPPDLARQLSQPTNNPSIRFRVICKQLEGRTFDEVWAWSEAVRLNEADAMDALGPRHRGLIGRVFGRNPEPSAWAPRPGGSDEDVARQVQAVLRHLGIRVSATDDEEVKKLASSWLRYRSLYAFAAGLDRYAQTCVIEIPRWQKRELIKGPETLQTFDDASFLLVSITYAEGFQVPALVPEGGVMIAFEAKAGIVPTWLTDDPSARYYLEARADSTAVLANSSGYDVARGDYQNREILSGIPHAVVATSDFRNLWQRLALMSETGLAGSRLIEWQTMPMERGGGVFGYLLLKPSGRPFPIIVNPTMINQLDRVLSVADVVPSPFGTALIESFIDLDAWLGDLAPAVYTAAALFSSESEIQPGAEPD
jgi:hypothetical protein